MHGGVHRNFPPKVVLQQSGWEFGATAYLAGVMWLLQPAGVAATSAQQPTSNLFSFIEPGAASASSLVSPCTAAPTFGLVAGGDLGGWQRRESAASRRPAAACHRSLRAIGAAWSPAGAVKHGALAQIFLVACPRPAGSSTHCTHLDAHGGSTRPASSSTSLPQLVSMAF